MVNISVHVSEVKIVSHEIYPEVYILVKSYVAIEFALFSLLLCEMVSRMGLLLSIIQNVPGRPKPHFFANYRKKHAKKCK